MCLRWLSFAALLKGCLFHLTGTARRLSRPSWKILWREKHVLLDWLAVRFPVSQFPIITIFDSWSLLMWSGFSIMFCISFQRANQHSDGMDGVIDSKAIAIHLIWVCECSWAAFIFHRWQQGLSSSRPAAFHGDRKAIHSATGLVFYHVVTSSKCKSLSPSFSYVSLCVLV